MHLRLLLCVSSFLAVVARGDDPPPSDDAVRAIELKVRVAEVEFIKAQIELEQIKTRQRVGQLQEQLAAAQAAIAELKAAEIAALANVGFVPRWLVLGPIRVDEKVSQHDEASCKEMLDRQYVPADAAPRDGDKATIDGTELAWKAVELTEFAVDLSKIADDAGKASDNAAYLGIVYITAPVERSGIKLAIGSDDGCVWRLNGKEVIRSYAGRGVERDQNLSEELTLKAGANVLAFTVLNGGSPAGAAARFVEKDGRPVEGLTCSVIPAK